MLPGGYLHILRQESTVCSMPIMLVSCLTASYLLRHMLSEGSICHLIIDCNEFFALWTYYRGENKQDIYLEDNLLCSSTIFMVSLRNQVGSLLLLLFFFIPCKVSFLENITFFIIRLIHQKLSGISSVSYLVAQYYLILSCLKMVFIVSIDF